jgi:hypothetical protein
MGKIKIISILLILGFVCFTLINRYVQRQKDPTLYRIFQASDYENFFLRFVGIIPHRFKTIYESRIIESGDNYYLKKIFRKSKVPSEVGYILGVEGEEEFIVAFLYPLKRNQDLTGITYEKHLDYLVDYDLLNEYLALSNNKCQDAILNKLAFFLSEEDISIKIENLVQLIRLKEEIMERSGSIPDEKEFNEKIRELDFDKYYYFWFPRIGLVQFDLKIENGQITRHNTSIVGFMGLAYPPL